MILLDYYNVMKKRFLITSLFILSLVPGTPALAQFATSGSSGFCNDNVENIYDVFMLFICIIRKSLVPLLITLSIVIFIWGVVNYIRKGEEAAEREEGRKFMLYGIIALFVMVSMWGLVAIIQGTFGLGTDTLIPQLQGI